MPCDPSSLRRHAAAMLALGGMAGAQAMDGDAALGASAPALTPATAPAFACARERPALNFNRWNEDWSALADPCLPRKPLDGLKYVPLGDDGQSYLSLGAGLRERYEHIDAPLYGAGVAPADGYLIQRANLHADLRLGPGLQVFGQLLDARAWQKQSIGPADEDKLDLEQLFVAFVLPSADGAVKLRAGRQEMAFDLQRFIAVRDGPNVRQAFDGIWGDWEQGRWRWIGFATHPVQNRSVHSFDDFSNGRLRLNGLRVERQGWGPGDWSAYYARFRHDGVRFLDAAGDERRDVYDMRYNGKSGRVDWDVEGMLQRGRVSARPVSAWALGSIVGATLDGAWRPRVGLQFDMASGDRRAGDGKLGTFDPLFANGYYFSLAGLTGYSNLVHLKPSVSVHPAAALSVTTALGLQWRQTTGDAVYVQNMAAVPGTAGQGTRWTGAYAQLRADWQFDPNLVASLEAVHFRVGDSLRAVGGRDANYLGVELKFGW